MIELNDNEKVILVLKKDWDYPPHPEKEKGHFIGRKDELCRLIDNLLRRDSGSILVSGDRGVGKTSLVYKALQEVKKQNKKTIPVILNALQLEIDFTPTKDKPVQQELNKKIIKNLIRRFYVAAISGERVKESRSEMEDLYKKVRSSEFEITEKTGVFDIEGDEEYLTILKELKFSISDFKTIIVAASVGLSVFLQFNPLTSNEIIDKILPLLALFPLPIVTLYSVKHKKTKSIQKEKTKSAEECYKYDFNIGNLEYDFEQILLKLNEKGYKIIFVVDELDKLREDAVIQVITSFKNLFNLSSSIFILISGKEIFNKIENSKAGRTTDYTLFTNRLFLSRPSFEDIEEFIDEIIESPNIEDLRKNEDYKEFRNYLCYKAKTDFFDLYNVIPDYISSFDEEHHPLIELPKLSSSDLLKSRLQKAMGQIYELYKYQMPSRWYDNERLLSNFYTFLDELLAMSANDQFNDLFEKGAKFEKIAKRDFCKYLARLGVISKIKDEKKTVSGVSQTVTTYTWMGICDSVPSQVTTLMKFEDTFVQKFDIFSNKILGLINAYRRIKSQMEFSILDLREHPTQMLNFLKDFANIDFTSIYDGFNKIRRNLKKRPPEHYKREDLEQYCKNLDDHIISLRNNSRIFVEKTLREIYTHKQFSQLQSNANLFSVMQNLRGDIITKKIQHCVIHNQDLSKQILLSFNIPEDTLHNNKKLIMQNTNTLKIVNVKTNINLNYVKVRYGFWNIDVTENFGDISKIIKKIKNWF